MRQTVVMIHGMWGGPWHWDYYRTVFERRGYHCVVPTLRHHDMDPHAMPDPRLGRVGLLDYAADLEREIGALGASPVVMGHSMGGLLTQILASRGLARAAVLLTPASPRGIDILKPSVLKVFFAVIMRWGSWRKPCRISLARAAYGALHLLPRELQEEEYGGWVYESGRAVFEIGLWFLDRRRASAVDARSVTCPVLVIGARHDRMTPASVVRKVARKYGGVATYKEFEDHAHHVLREPGWEEVANYVLAWLEQALALASR